MKNIIEQWTAAPDLVPVRQKRRDKRLHEEVIECGRRYGGPGNRKTRERGKIRNRQRMEKLDTVPYRERIRQQGRVGIRTFPSDNLEPMFRWLLSQVGLHWDQVYAEVGKVARPDSMHGAHIRAHLFDFVEVHVRMDADGNPVLGRVQFGFLHSVGKALFVHPVTGILTKNPAWYKKNKGPYPKKARWKKEKEKIRSHIRQGIGHQPEACNKGLEISDWKCFRLRQQTVGAGDILDIRQQDMVYRAEVTGIGVKSVYRHKKGGFPGSGSHHDVLELHLRVVESLHMERKVGKSIVLTVQRGDDADWLALEKGRLF